MRQLEKLYEQVHAAKQKLADAINKEFPVGTVVSVKMSRGHMGGVVAFETRDNRIRVRADSSGRVHHKHFSDVLKMR